MLIVPVERTPLARGTGYNALDKDGNVIGYGVTRVEAIIRAFGYEPYKVAMAVAMVASVREEVSH